MDASNLYVVDAAVWQHPLGGGPSVMLDASNPAAGTQGAVVVDGADVYWNSAGDGLFKAPIGGGAVTVVVPGGSERFALAIDAAHVYWSDGASIRATSKLDGTTVVVASNGGATSLAADATRVYSARADGVYSFAKP